VDVKHSAALSKRPLAERVAELLERGRADGIVVSGTGTGRETDHDHLKRVVAARDELNSDAPVFVGSGVTSDTVTETLDLAGGVVVGTVLKEGGETTAPVDVKRVRALVAATRD
jgi:predicted TIM-barrel enzyme